jgi:AraC-like DNA-binding protein
MRPGDPTIRLPWLLRPGVVFREREYPAEAVLDRHVHAHTTLILVLRGAIQEACDRGPVFLRQPGELHILPAGIRHSTRIGPSGARAFLVGLYDDWLDQVSERRRAVAAPACNSRGTRPAMLGHRMYHEFLAGDGAAGLSLEGLLLETLGTIMRDRAGRRPGPAPRWLARARDRLAAEFARPPDIADLASDAGVSIGYFYRAFHTHFRCTPGQCVRQARVEFARRALLTTSRSIAGIANEAGFGDQAHLTRCFRDLVGLTPGAYRRQAADPSVAG